SKDVFQVIMVVSRIFTGAARGSGEGGKLAREPQQFLVEAFRMHEAGFLEMKEYRNLSVQKLQHEIIDALQPASRCAIYGIAGKFPQLVFGPADNTVQPTLDDRMRCA